MKPLMYPTQNRCLMNFVNFVNQAKKKKKTTPIFSFLNYPDSSHLIQVSSVHVLYLFVFFFPHLISGKSAHLAAVQIPHA